MLSAQSSVWDGVYTNAQAARGEALYKSNCASCHGGKLEGQGQAPALAGEEFSKSWKGMTLGDLFDTMRTTMPADRPGELSKQQNADILAFILKSNQYPAGAKELPADTDALNKIQIGEKKTAAFEVASVKENKSGALGQTGESTPGRYSARNAPLRGLIMDAYEIDQRMQLTGGPAWIETARFDIEAKAPDNADRPTVHRMLQALLAERFQLAVHHETKEMPVYFLVVAKGGPKLRDLKSANERTPAPDSRLVGSRGAFIGFTLGLTRILGRMVIDKTGITGSYDMRLELRTEDYPPVTAGNAQMPASATAGAAVLAAIEPQLGLKLESGKAPVNVLVIDSVQRPSAN